MFESYHLKRSTVMKENGLRYSLSKTGAYDYTHKLNSFSYYHSSPHTYQNDIKCHFGISVVTNRMPLLTKGHKI